MAHRKNFMGECTKEDAFGVLDHFHESGGNFIDTANIYMGGESEEWLGDWMAERGVRDQMVVATKYSTPVTLPLMAPQGPSSPIPAGITRRAYACRLRRV
jgi:aryl-alcohol dehydrogenase-like predicted oxidoreductase